MTVDVDPFRHHPELRDKITDPLASDYRDLDLALLDEKMLAIGAGPDWRLCDAAREQSRITILDGRTDDDLWVFAYGSLMWDPAFRFSEVRSALLKGYQRSFCLQSVLGRGTPERPGLMAGLDHGDSCHGLVFRIDRDAIEEETRIVWRREMIMHAYRPTFVDTETRFGPISALTFVIDHAGKHYRPGLNKEETAGYLATGEGMYGTSFAYIENLVGHLRTIGIEDPPLFQLFERARQMRGH